MSVSGHFEQRQLRSVGSRDFSLFLKKQDKSPEWTATLLSISPHLWDAVGSFGYIRAVCWRMARRTVCSAGLLVPKLLPPILSLSRAQLGTPLAQQQLDTFCSCSLLRGLCKSSHLDLVEQKYSLPLYSFSLILSYREMLSWSSTASLDHLSLSFLVEFCTSLENRHGYLSYRSLIY